MTNTSYNITIIQGDYGDDKKVCYYTLAERNDFVAVACL